MSAQEEGGHPAVDGDHGTGSGTFLDWYDVTDAMQDGSQGLGSGTGVAGGSPSKGDDTLSANRCRRCGQDRRREIGGWWDSELGEDSPARGLPRRRPAGSRRTRWWLTSVGEVMGGARWHGRHGVWSVMSRLVVDERLSLEDPSRETGLVAEGFGEGSHGWGIGFVGGGRRWRTRTEGLGRWWFQVAGEDGDAG